VKVDCKIIEDMLPLYLDEVCSIPTKQMVEEHLKECETCRKLKESMQGIPVPSVELEQIEDEKVLKKGFQKIRIRWRISLLAAMIILPLLFLGWNQYRHVGICFTNLNELQIGNAFMSKLQKSDYEGAYRYINIDGIKQDWTDEFFEEEELGDIKEKGLVKFSECAEKIEGLGGIESFSFVGVSTHVSNGNGKDSYQLVYKTNIDGNEEMFLVQISNGGVENFVVGNGDMTAPLTQFSMWREYLWQEYEGCYFDIEQGKYVYPDEK